MKHALMNRKPANHQANYSEPSNAPGGLFAMS
jgi:hypothetical protein